LAFHPLAAFAPFLLKTVSFNNTFLGPSSFQSMTATHVVPWGRDAGYAHAGIMALHACSARRLEADAGTYLSFVALHLGVVPVAGCHIARSVLIGLAKAVAAIALRKRPLVYMSMDVVRQVS
jgi:hypothetical protein